MKIDSPYWNWNLGVCKKHNLPQVPCPACMAEQDSDVEVRVADMDIVALDSDPRLTVRDLLPDKDGDWLMERIHL